MRMAPTSSGVNTCRSADKTPDGNLVCRTSYEHIVRILGDGTMWPSQPTSNLHSSHDPKSRPAAPPTRPQHADRAYSWRRLINISTGRFVCLDDLARQGPGRTLSICTNCERSPRTRLALPQAGTVKLCRKIDVIVGSGRPGRRTPPRPGPMAQEVNVLSTDFDNSGFPSAPAEPMLRPFKSLLNNEVEPPRTRVVFCVHVPKAAGNSMNVLLRQNRSPTSPSAETIFSITLLRIVGSNWQSLGRPRCSPGTSVSITRCSHGCRNPYVTLSVLPHPMDRLLSAFNPTLRQRAHCGIRR